MTSRRGAHRRSPRRVHVIVALCALAAVGIVVTGLPVSALMTQHRQLDDASAQLSQVASANSELRAEVDALSKKANVEGLARSEYGLAPAGQKVYEILPPEGSSASTVTGSGHVPLDGPAVAPGSAQSQQLLGMGGSLPAASGSTSSGGSTAHQASHHGGGSDGFWSRVLRSLEFWR